MTIQDRKDNLARLAEKALVTQIPIQHSSLAFLSYIQWLTPYYSFLYHLCQEMKPEKMVEIGTECGIGCIHMALGNPNGNVTTIDVHDMHELVEGYSFFKDIHNIEMVVGDSTVEHARFADESIDLLFIDGDHRYAYAKADYDLWYQKVKTGGLILLDDTQLDEEMERFWEEIQEPKIDLSIIRRKDEYRPGRGAGFGVVLK